jgi:hypothetical protein
VNHEETKINILQLSKSIPTMFKDSQLAENWLRYRMVYLAVPDFRDHSVAYSAAAGSEANIR